MAVQQPENYKDELRKALIIAGIKNGSYYNALSQRYKLKFNCESDSSEPDLSGTIVSTSENEEGYFEFVISPNHIRNEPVVGISFIENQWQIRQKINIHSSSKYIRVISFMIF